MAPSPRPGMGFAILLAAVSVTAGAYRAQAAQASPLELDEPDTTARNEMFEPYRPNYAYFAYGYFDDGSWYPNLLAKFQFSSSLRIARMPTSWRERLGIQPIWALFIGYSQTTLWDLYEYSSPIQEHMFSPDIYFAKSGTGESARTRTKFGWNHESNGLEGASSRSWNRVFFEFTIGDEWLAAPRIDGVHQLINTLTIRPWYAVKVAPQNPDIASQGLIPTNAGFNIVAGSRLGSLASIEMETRKLQYLQTNVALRFEVLVNTCLYLIRSDSRLLGESDVWIDMSLFWGKHDALSRYSKTVFAYGAGITIMRL